MCDWKYAMLVGDEFKDGWLVGLSLHEASSDKSSPLLTKYETRKSPTFDRHRVTGERLRWFANLSELRSRFRLVFVESQSLSSRE